MKDYGNMTNKTRNKGKLSRLPYVKLKYSKKSFKFNGPKELNCLPLELRNAGSSNALKICFDRIFIRLYIDLIRGTKRKIFLQ